MSTGLDYPDWQRVVNWDSPILYADSANNVTTYKQSGALDVSRYAYLGGFASVTAGYCLVTLEWFLDQGMTTIVGQRQFTLHSGIVNICQPKIPHMGPFLQVTFEALASSPFSGSWSLFATNRVYPVEFVPVNPTLIYQSGTNIGGGGIDYYYPDSYYAGPIQYRMTTAAAGVEVFFESLDPSAVWETLVQVNPATSPGTIGTLIIPTGAWRVEVYNPNAGSTQFDLVVIPSTTGSS